MTMTKRERAARRLLSGSEIDRYGFQWGSPGEALVQVTRAASVERARGVHRCLTIQTERQTVNVYVSPTGAVTVYKDFRRLR